jgi:dTDP-4-dehydrorhamnose 3,5-epimerase-like enzyme
MPDKTYYTGVTSNLEQKSFSTSKWGFIWLLHYQRRPIELVFIVSLPI